MGETVVKQGYFDKAAGPNSTETNSARNTIWPNLSQKNMMGLQTLSYLYTSVMEKRQLMGKCTAPSTFRPPPRVTVTDTKREAWLRDLANPEVPLRKQSRTIPHGIRGKSLMEQCLSKNIPMPRAVWLAKCVGANELRAFRRKGVSGAAAASGESKWVMDWTVNVEQFLEGVIASCGQPDWQTRMDYAVKLATSFFTERLLERDHYMDWVVSSFAGAKTETLPIWIVMIQLYWKDITAFGRRGRQLAEAALENLHQISVGKTSVHDTLKARLKKLIMVLAVTNRGCLIIPRTWEKYKYLLVPNTFTPEGRNAKSPAHNIARRNDRMTAPLLKTPQNTQCALLKLYSRLDSAGLTMDLAKLSAECVALVSNIPHLVAATLDWSASSYRTGFHRVYLAAGILAQLRRGHDTDAAIMGYMQSSRGSTIDMSKVHRVIAELVRMECFSTGRYFQWLMTSGALSSDDATSPATGLLQRLPANVLQPHLVNTRNMLLRRLGLLKDENPQIDTLLRRIQVSQSSIDVKLSDLANAIDALLMSAKFELARLVSNLAVESGKQGDMTLQYFCVTRDTLERCDDARALADVVQSAANSDITTILATLCDTISMHAKSFAALGRLEGSISQIVERYYTVRSQQPLDRTFIVALKDLMKRFPERAHLIKLLDQDMAICEQQNSMMVCSPASDSIVNMQATSLVSDSDIDAVFASGNNMDEQLMQRVFSRVVERAAKSVQVDHSTPSKVCGWLNQLRTVAVDPSSFDQMAANHVKASFENAGDTVAPCKVIAALVASGCMSLDTIFSTAAAVKKPGSASLAIRLLTQKTSVFEGLHAAEAYRYRVQQDLYCEEKAGEAIAMMVCAMDDPDFLVEEPGVMNLLLRYSVSEYDVGRKALSNHPRSKTFLVKCLRVIKELLNLGSDPAEVDSRLTAQSIVAAANPLSIIQCTAALRLFSILQPDGIESMQKAVLDAVTAGSDVWPQLLESAGTETVHNIYSWAREQVLNDALPSKGSSQPIDEAGVARNLDILDVAFHAAKEDDVDSIIATVTEKLKALEAQLSTSASPADTQRLLSSLGTLLHLATLYSSRASNAADNNAPSQPRIALLTTLCSLLIRPALQLHNSLLEYIHDVASTLSDSLPDTILSNLAKNITTKDPRLSNILGCSPNPDAWLAIVSNPTLATMMGGGQGLRGLARNGQPGPTGLGIGGSGHQLSPQQIQQAQFSGRPLPPQHPLLQQQQQQILQQQQQQAMQSQMTSPQQGSSAATFVKTSGGVGVLGGLPRGEVKVAPFPLRRWEIMSDATPVVGGNDTSLSLGLFGARRV
jgi:mediator of RNA polymerase II transcription subunit 12